MQRQCLVGAVACALWASLFSSAFAAERIGQVVAVDGSPSAEGPGGTRKLSAGAAVFVGDTIRVGFGNAQILLDDGTRLVVGQGSRLTLTTFLKANDTTAQKVGIKALRGTFRFISGKSKTSAYDIATPNATIGIRGTGFDFGVANRTVVAVHEGSVRLRGNNNQSVILNAGCEVGEAGAGATPAIKLVKRSKSAALQQRLRFAVNQSRLRQLFRLPITACKAFLTPLESPAPNGSGEKRRDDEEQ